jgi:hypothetical protein
VHAAWAELTDLATDLGFPLRPSESPRSGANRLAAHVASAAAAEPLEDAQAGATAIRRIATAEELARYAPPDVPWTVPPEAVAHDLALAAKVLRASTTKSARAWATIAPQSVLGRKTMVPGDRAHDEPETVGQGRS